MAILTPNMSLPVSSIGADTGLTWETNLNAALSILDQHTHNPGSGVQITPSGLNINAGIQMNDNALLSTSAVFFQNQGSPIPSTNIRAVYSSGVDLWYNDGNGNQIQLTSGGLVNATSSGIASGTASAAFVGGVLVVNAAALTPANIQVASILMGNNTSGTNYLTLAPPNAMAFSFNLTLPLPPTTSTSFLQIDTSGNITAGPLLSGGITGSMISSTAGITASQLNLSTITTLSALALPATQVTAGALGAGVTISATELTAGAIGSGVTGGSGLSIATSQLTGTISASQITSGTITTTQISASAGITGSQLSASAGIVGSQIVTNVSLAGSVVKIDGLNIVVNATTGAGGQKIIKGIVNGANGAIILSDSNFSVNFVGGGEYQIIFTTAFSGPPTVLLTGEWDGATAWVPLMGSSGITPTAGNFICYMTNAGAQQAGGLFSFIAIGPI